MHLEEITLALFAACNSVRIFAYVPQIHKAATDTNGASAISGTTWSLFLVAHLSTIAHALVNLSDWWLATCFAGNAACCVAILGIAYWKRRRHGLRKGETAAPVVQRHVLSRRAPSSSRCPMPKDEQRGFATHALPWRASA